MCMCICQFVIPKNTKVQSVAEGKEKPNIFVN